MFGNSEWNQAEELRSREKDMSNLVETEGWMKLTGRQKRMIELSLYAQARAERTTDIASASAITSRKTHGPHVDGVFIEEESDLRRKHLISGYPDPYERKYRKSQNFITDSSCHMAILSLESGVVVSGDKFNAPMDFFKADYQNDINVSRLQDRVESFGFPCVVHIMADRSDDAVHSFLVLGHDSHKETIIWEKKNFYMQYQVTTLEDVFHRYDGNGYAYGLRGLKSER